MRYGTADYGGQQMLVRTSNAIFVLLLLFNAAAAFAAASPDIRLIMLIPTDSPVIAGMTGPPTREQLGSVLLVTRNNGIDLEDFFAVTGGDSSRLIQQAVLVAGADAKGSLSEHSLLVSGHFNKAAIFRFAAGGKARTETYRGVTVLAVPAFARESDRFSELRWFAVVDSNITIFGSVAMVQRELDRAIDNSPADPFLLKRLSRLGRAVDAWCLFPSPKSTGVIQAVFEELDPRLGALARQGASMQYGIRFGRHVEIIASSNVDAEASIHAQNDHSAATSVAASSFVTRTDSAGEDDQNRAVVDLSWSRYKAWMSELAKRRSTMGAPLSR